MSHPSESLLEQYVIGALQGAESDAFESHVMACRSCADRLAREARLEVQLKEAARRLASSPRSSWGSGRTPGRRALRWAAGAAAFGAVAASVLLMTHRPSFGGSSTGLEVLPAAAHVSPDTRDQLMVRNDAVAIDGLDESMAGSDLDSDTARGGPAQPSQSGAMQ